MKLKHAFATAACVLAFSMGSQAEASPYKGQIPGGTAENDALDPLFDRDTLNGWYNANLYLVGGDADIQVDILGYEAGFTNTFSFETFSWTNIGSGVGDNTWSLAGHVTHTLLDVAAGLLDFSFKSFGDGVTNTVSNLGSNPGDGGVNFFMSFFDGTDGSDHRSSGQSVLLFFDDHGKVADGSPHDNHDDLVVRLSISNGTFVAPIPIPAAGFLLLGGLGVLGAAGLRRRRKES